MAYLKTTKNEDPYFMEDKRTTLERSEEKIKSARKS